MTRICSLSLGGLFAASLAACTPRIDLPQQETTLVLRAALVTLAACTQRLDADGNVDEATIRAFGWTPQTRRTGRVVTRGDTTGFEERNVPPATPVRMTSPDQSEYSDWAHPSWQGMLSLSRSAGPLAERTMGQCEASYYGRDAATADQVLTAMTQRLGEPARRGERSRGGDWLTPRWFEPVIHEVYWRLPFHDVYWLSSDPRLVTVEVRAMPDRAALGQMSVDPAEQNRTGENGL